MVEECRMYDGDHTGTIKRNVNLRGKTAMPLCDRVRGTHAAPMSTTFTTTPTSVHPCLIQGPQPH